MEHKRKIVLILFHATGPHENWGVLYEHSSKKVHVRLVHYISRFKQFISYEWDLQ